MRYHVMFICEHCGKEFRSKNKTARCCSHTCDREFRHVSYIDRWLDGEETGVTGSFGEISAHIERYLRATFDDKCQQCGWNQVNPFTQKVPLTIHHKDGNYENNRPDNLALLCANCHSLTESYGSRNRGKGRPRYASLG